MSEIRNSTLTTKFGKGFEASWYVAAGSPDEIKAQLISFFDLGSWAEDKSPAEVSVEASRLAQAMFSGQQVLGASPMREEPAAKPASKPPAPRSEPAADPWAGLAPAADSLPHGELLAQIEAVSSKQELTQLWHKNRQAWTDPAVAEAARAKVAGLAA